MPSSQFGEIAKVWTFASSSGSGTYETLKHVSGEVTCNCPGWTRRVAPDGSRSCKHTRAVDMNVADGQAESFKDYKGEKAQAKAKAKVEAPVVVEAPRTEAPVKAEGIVRKIRW